MALTAGKTCYVWVHFHPERAGSFTGTLKLITRSTGKVVATVALGGTGTTAAAAGSTANTGQPANRNPRPKPATTTKAPAKCAPARFGIPLTSSFDRYSELVAERRFLADYQAQVRAALAKHPELGTQLRSIDRALTRLIARAPQRVRSLSAASDGNPSAVNVAINDQCDKGLKALRDHLAEYLVDAKVKGATKARVEALADNLLILDRLLDPRYAEDVKPEEKKKILNDAMVGLVSTLGGADKGELTKNGKQLYDVLSGGLDDKEKSALVRGKLKELVKKAFGKDAEELTGQLTTLYDVLSGDLDDTKREEVLKQSMIGLFTKITGKELLDIPQVQAVIFGWEIAAPFGKTIAEELKQIKMYSLYLSCQSANAGTNTGGTVTIKDPGGPFEGWEVTSYKDPDLNRIVWAVSRPATFLDGVLGRKTTYILDPKFPGLVIGSN